MRRIARIFGLLGGIGAVIWAMRDRFVSVAISREPEPPAFRAVANPNGGRPQTPPPVTKQAPNAASEATEDESELTDVNGIGPVYANRLNEAGIRSLDDLSSSRAEQVAAAAEVPLSRAIGWIEAARGLT